MTDTGKLVEALNALADAKHDDLSIAREAADAIKTLTAERDSLIEQRNGEIVARSKAEIHLIEARGQASRLRVETAQELSRLGEELAKAMEIIEDAVETLESMDLHTNNPLYNRLCIYLDAAAFSTHEDAEGK